MEKPADQFPLDDDPQDGDQAEVGEMWDDGEGDGTAPVEPVEGPSTWWMLSRIIYVVAILLGLLQIGLAIFQPFVPYTGEYINGSTYIETAANPWIIWIAVVQGILAAWWWWEAGSDENPRFQAILVYGAFAIGLGLAIWSTTWDTPPRKDLGDPPSLLPFPPVRP